MSWSNGEVPLTFTNGLTRSSATAKLGGTLTESTTITQPGTIGLNFVNSGSANTVFNLTGTGDLDIQDNGTSVLFVSDEGKIGIGNTSPYANMDIIGDIHQYYPGNDNGIYVTGTTSLALAWFGNDFAGNTWGLSAGCTNGSAGPNSYGLFGFTYGTGYAIYGKSFNSSGTGVYGINQPSGNYGYLGSTSYGIYGLNGTYGNFGYIGGDSYGVYGQYGSGNYGYLGGSTYASYAYNQASGNYGHIAGTNFSLYGYLSSTNLGDYAIYGYGVHSNGVDGTGYSYYSSLGSVKGYNFYGNPYTFGVAGYSYLDYDRSGATFGGYYSGIAPWGCLAYQNSAGTSYGGYFTSYTSGAGKSSGVLINSGIGAWGDLFGADIHGKVYGAYMEGSDYGAYVNGDSFKNGLDVHLQKESDGKNIPLYTHVSTEMTIQTCGFATLSNGFCQVEFDPSFAAAVSASSPVIVTITPMGNTGGVYLSDVTSAGFRAVENNNGKSTVQVSYIAIGKRAGYENPVLPEAVVAGDYVDKLNAGLHNDADSETDGLGLYYENGKLYTGKHASTLPDPNKPATDPNVDQAALPVQGQMTRPVVQKHPDRGTGAAPQKEAQKQE
jgi:hypothetical protein